MGHSYYLEIVDFPDKKKTTKIPILSVGFANSGNIKLGNTGSVGREPERPELQEISIDHKLDNYSQMLLQEVAYGNPHTMRIIFYNDAAKRADTTMTLDEAMFTRFSPGSVGNDPVENLTINFTKITFKYDPAVRDVKTATWDLSKVP